VLGVLGRQALVPGLGAGSDREVDLVGVFALRDLRASGVDKPAALAEQQALLRLDRRPLAASRHTSPRMLK